MIEQCSLCLRDRELGNLEGRLDSMENRTTKIEQCIREGFSESNRKLDALTVTVEALNMDKARRAGGWAVLTLLFGLAGTIGGLLSNLLHLGK